MSRDPRHTTPPRPSTDEEVQRVLEAAERSRHESESQFDAQTNKAAQRVEQGADRTRATGDKVADKISETGHKAAEKADQFASAVSEQSHRTAHRADEAADKMHGTSTQTFQARAQEAQHEINARADASMTSAGQRMSDMAHTLRERAPQGRAGEFAGRAASALEQSGNYLQRSNPDSVRSDLEMTIRQHPIESLLVGAGVGFILARMFNRRG